MLEKASNAKKILMLFMSENAKNYAGLFYRWLVTARLARTCTQKMNKIMKKSFYMYVYIHDRVQRSNAVVYRVVL